MLRNNLRSFYAKNLHISKRLFKFAYNKRKNNYRSAALSKQVELFKHIIMGKDYKSIADDTLKSIEQGYYYNRNINNEDMIDSFRKRFKE
jgi:hypothetical protein